MSKKLSELKSNVDFKILRMGNDGVEQNGPDRCQPKPVPVRILAGGQVWCRSQTWTNKGLGSYLAHYEPVSEGPEPSKEWQEEKAKARVAAHNEFMQETLQRIMSLK